MVEDLKWMQFIQSSEITSDKNGTLHGTFNEGTDPSEITVSEKSVSQVKIPAWLSWGHWNSQVQNRVFVSPKVQQVINVTCDRK